MGNSMKLGSLTLSGTVGLIQERTGVKDGKSWAMRTALIPSLHQTFRVLLPDDLHDRVVAGEYVELDVYPDVYNGKVTYRATGFAWAETDAARSA